MLTHFCLIRDGVTSTSLTLQVEQIDFVRRWVASSIRHSGSDAVRYHFIAYGVLQDISGTDRLEEITGTVTGIVYSILNKREVHGSHLEFDLEAQHG